MSAKKKFEGSNVPLSEAVSASNQEFANRPRSLLPTISEDDEDDEDGSTLTDNNNISEKERKDKIQAKEDSRYTNRYIHEDQLSDYYAGLESWGSSSGGGRKKRTSRKKKSNKKRKTRRSNKTNKRRRRSYVMRPKN